MNPQQQALGIIRAEHRTLTAVIDAFDHVTQDMSKGTLTPDYKLLWSIIYYIEEFPERLHHPKESDLLFPKLARRAPELMPVIERLEREHMRGEGTVRELQHLLLG